MSTIEYAKHRGVSRTAVMKAIGDGRLSGRSASKDQRGRWRIVAERADDEWAANSRQLSPDAIRKQRSARAAKAKPGDRLLVFGPETIPVNEEGRPLSKIEAQTILEAVKAQQAKLEFAEKCGRLLRADDVARRWSEMGRRVNDGVLAVPARIAQQLARMTDPAEIEILLETELTNALRAIAAARAA